MAKTTIDPSNLPSNPDKEALQAIIDAYTKQNPVKAAAKQEEFAKKLAALG